MLRILTEPVQSVAPSVVGVLKYAPTQPRDHRGRFAETATITLDGRTVEVVKPKRAYADKLVLIDVAKWEASFSRQSGFYVGPEGKGGISDRYQRFGEYIAKHDSIEAAEVGVRPDGVVDFTNGRHRYAWLRDHGVTQMPVAMERESLEHARKHGYLVEAQKWDESKVVRDAEGQFATKPTLAERYPVESYVGGGFKVMLPGGGLIAVTEDKKGWMIGGQSDRYPTSEDAILGARLLAASKEPKPKPPFKSHTAEEAEAIIAEAKAKGQRVLFHSGDASRAADLAEGIQPQMGDWVQEVLSGATDDEDALQQIQDDPENAVAYYSETPEWVSMKASRVIEGRHVTDITPEELEQHGHLSIVIADPDDEDLLTSDENQMVYRVGSDEARRENIPFGVEPGDIYTQSERVPDVSLTGKELLRFLNRNYPESNLLKGNLSAFKWDESKVRRNKEKGHEGEFADKGPTVKLYRGDAAAISPALAYSDPGALFGAGIYLTDSKRIAGDYRHKGGAQGELFRFGGGPKSTKKEAIERYIRTLARGYDAEGNKLKWDEPLSGYSGDFESPELKAKAASDAARIAHATKAWQEMRDTVDIRKLADGTIVFHQRGPEDQSAGHLSEYDIPESWVKKTLNAEAPITDDVADALYNMLRKENPGLAREVHRMAMQEDEDGFRPSFRTIYQAANEPMLSGGLNTEEGQLRFRRALKELGFKGIRYEGGITMGGARHNAYVFWDEQGLKKQRRKFDPSQPRDEEGQWTKNGSVELIHTVASWAEPLFGNPSPLSSDQKAVAGRIGKVEVGLHVRDTLGQPMVWIGHLEATPMKKGHGPKFMQRLTALADEKGVTLALEPHPIDPARGKRIPQGKLVEFYTKLGFVLDESGSLMTRRPKVEKWDEAKHPRDAEGQFTTFYHGTLQEQVDSIKEHGLQMSHSGLAWPGLSQPGTIYLGKTKEAAMMWAESTTLRLEWKFDNPTAVVLEVRVPAAVLEKSQRTAEPEGNLRVFQDIPPDWIVGVTVGRSHDEILGVTRARMRREENKVNPPIIPPFVKAIKDDGRTFYIGVVVEGDEVQSIAKKGEHAFGNTQIPIAPTSSAAASLNTARAAIRDEHCIGTGKDVDPNHVTVRYGILPETDVDTLRTFIASQTPFEATLGSVELFPASEHSDGAVPVVARIVSPELRLIEQRIGKHAHFKPKNFPVYKPHCTLAYVQPEKAPFYANLFVHGSFVVQSITISHASGVQETIPFGMAQKWNPQQPRDERGRFKGLGLHGNQVTVLHGTTRANAESILSTGFKPGNPAAVAAQVEQAYKLPEGSILNHVAFEFAKGRRDLSDVHFTTDESVADQYSVPEVMQDALTAAHMLLHPHPEDQPYTKEHHAQRKAWIAEQAKRLLEPALLAVTVPFETVGQHGFGKALTLEEFQEIQRKFPNSDDWFNNIRIPIEALRGARIERWKREGKSTSFHNRPHWQEAKHPRHPKGSSRGGEFMETLHGPRDALTALMEEDKDVNIQAGDVRRFMELAGELPEGIDPDLTKLQVEGHTIFGGNGLGIKREDMPQIPPEHREQFLKFLEKEGVKISRELVDPLALKPTQSEVSARRAGAKLAKYENNPKKKFPAVLVSDANRILDGHHHWGMMAAFALEAPGAQMPITRIHLGTKKTLALMHAYMKIHKLSRASLSGATVKFDPNQPRDESGKWTSLMSGLHEYATSSGGVGKQVKERVVVVHQASGKVLADYEQQLEVNESLTAYEGVPGTGFSNADMFVPGTTTAEMHPDNAILHLHTHPIDQSFSDGDWRIFSRSTIGEMRVATPELEYRLKKTPEYLALHWTQRTPAKMQEAYDRIQDEVFNDVYPTHGHLSGDAFVNEVLRETTVRMAKHFKVEYQERQRTKKADPATGRYVTPFVSFEKQGDEQLRMIASLNSSRLATWGFTAEAEVLGMVRYKLTAVLDGRTSKFCKMIDGKIFDVSDARRKVIEVLNVQNPDDLKTVQPWPKQTKADMAMYAEMSAQDFVDRGWHIPPYHPHCRTILRHVPSSIGKATEPPVPTVPTETEVFHPVTAADLKELGIEATQEQVDQWNAHIGMTPTELISKLTGMPPQEVLTKGKGVGSKPVTFDSDGNIGVRAGGTTPKGIEFQVGAILDPFTGIYYLSEAALKAGTPQAELAFMKNLFKELINVGLKSSATSIGVNVAGNAAYYAKLGMLPDDLEWDALRAHTLEKLAEEPLQGLMAALTPEDRVLVQHLLQDASPSALSALVELPFTYQGRTLGEWMLAETSGLWRLDLEDAAMVAHARTYVS